MSRPLVVELYCGSFGWSRGFVAEGWRAFGFDIEHKPHHGPVPEGCELVLQDVRTLTGAQFREAECIVASPPCQKYSWLAMPWSRSTSEHSKAAKELRRKWEADGPDNELFAAAFRIQREASDAAGRYIPLIVENVRGAQEWVGAVFHGLDAWMATSREKRWRMGRSAWNFGSFHLWGDVPALMPMNRGLKSRTGGGWFGDYQGNASRKNDPRDVRKMPDGSWQTPDGTKIGGDWFRDPACHSKHASRSEARKAAAAEIARIPFDLANHIARVYRPREAA